MNDRVSENRISLHLAIRAITTAFRFEGRSTRTELISFYILSTIATMFVVSWDHAPPVSPLFVGLGIAWSSLWLWPLFPLTVRRLHDQDRSGWWAANSGLMMLAWLIVYLLPEDPTSHAYVSFTGLKPHHIGSSPLAWLCSDIFVVTVLAQWIMNLLPGTYGPNSFGRDPRLAEPGAITENLPADASA